MLQASTSKTSWTSVDMNICPQVSFGRFHPVIARHLAFTEHELTVCGMSLGYQIARCTSTTWPRAPGRA